MIDVAGKLLILFLFVFPIGISAQVNCVSPDRIQALRAELASKKAFESNNGLKKEIKNLRASYSKWSVDKAVNRSLTSEKGDDSPKDSVKTVSRLCSIINTQPWPSIDTVGAEGASDWLYLIKNYFTFDSQLKLMPVISEAIKNNAVEKDNDLASFIDRIRLRVGLGQLFGTQASMKDEFLVLAPLQSEQNVDKWRAEYHLQPLRDYIRNLELSFGVVLIKSTAKPTTASLPKSVTDLKGTKADDLVQSTAAEEEVLRIDTSIVTLDATVYGLLQSGLKKEEFKLYDDGVPQEITFFASVEAPFDLVLLLDLSGSTANQVDLIRKTTKKFIEMKRNADRISLITFAYNPIVVSPLESDRTLLLDRVSKIDDSGGSNVWDALSFSIDGLIKTSAPGRRKAVIFMTDGADNALMSRPNMGSKMLFAELLEQVRVAGISVFPIYLDTEGPGQSSIYADARRTLKLLADESGGTYFSAKDIGDLNTVYERVMQDIGSVYSLGYSPSTEKPDGSWHTLKVEIPSRPAIKVRTRSGYYSK
ncbi:hypothetical protein BH10ACI2_BH10ACI2_12930 [soil metagenome]